jgi:hypothetical protein
VLLRSAEACAASPEQQGIHDRRRPSPGYDGRRVFAQWHHPTRATTVLVLDCDDSSGISAKSYDVNSATAYDVKKASNIYIDVDGDGSCDPLNDRLFADARSVFVPELTVRGSGAAQGADLHTSSDPGHCAPFNSDWPSQ